MFCDYPAVFYLYIFFLIFLRFIKLILKQVKILLSDIIITANIDITLNNMFLIVK